MKDKPNTTKNQNRSTIAGLPARQDSSLRSWIEKIVWQTWEKTAAENGWPKDVIKPEEIKIEHPAEERFGDYSANIAMLLFAKIKNKKLKIKNINDNLKSPLELAQEITNNVILVRPAPGGPHPESDSGQVRMKEGVDSWPVFTCPGRASAGKQDRMAVKILEKVSVAPPGFINLTLANDYLVKQVYEAVKIGDDYGKTDFLAGQKIMVEFAHPNTHKAFHIGHLRNISTGEFMVRILETVGAKVIRSNYQGDVGLHIAKCLWALLKAESYKLKAISVKQKIDLLAKAYVEGSKAYEENEKAKEEIKDINYLIYAAAQKYQQKEHKIQSGSTDYLKFVKGKNIELDKIYDLWVETRQWSLDHFEAIYERVDSRFDRYYFESECLAGIDRCYEALEKGILKRGEDNAVIFDGTPYRLHTRVFVNSLGLPTYEGKELGLAPKELSEFGRLDRIIHVVTPEQTSFFAVTFKVEELLGWQQDQQYHLVYEWVKLKAGKMASRLGNVIVGEWLLDEVRKRIIQAFPEVDQKTAEEIAVGAVKYSFLKTGTGTPIHFDIEESISLQGNSGPYLQYTFARTQSVLAKAKGLRLKAQGQKKMKYGFQLSALSFKPNTEELSVLRYIYRFPEVVRQAAEEYAPNAICTYLYELAQRFNAFYNKHRIIQAQSSKLKAQNDNLKLDNCKFNENLKLKIENYSQTSNSQFDNSQLDNSQLDNSSFRLALTAAVAQILKNGFYLLGIKAPRKM